MSMPKWFPCHDQRPCPVCKSSRPGRDGSPCRVRETDGHVDVVWCTLDSLREDPGAAPGGWWLIRHPTEGETGVLLSPMVDGAPKVKECKPPPDERVARDADKWKQMGIDRAVSIWKGTSSDTVGGALGGRVAAYLKARGIDLARLPEEEGRAKDGLPQSIRWHARCPAQSANREAECGPAMVARIVEIGEKDGREFLATTGVHRTFLDPAGAPKKRQVIEDSKWWSGSKQMLGACNGRAVWLSRVFPRGAMVVGEGIETTLSAMTATGLGGWALLSAGGIQEMKVHLRLVHPKTGPVQTIIVAADLNKPPASREVIDVLLGRGSAGELSKGDQRKLDNLFSRAEKIAGVQVPGLPIAEARRLASLATGVQSGEILKARVELVYPWVRVEVRVPTAAAFPELVQVVEGGGEVGKPGADGKPSSVDWNDVLQACGPERVAAALLDGIDLAGNQVRARGWEAPVAMAGDVDEDDGLRDEPPPGDAFGSADTPPDPLGRSEERTRGGAGAAGGSAAGGSGRGGKGNGGKPPSQGGAGAAPSDDGDGWGRNVQLEDRSWRPLLPWDDQVLARLFLETFYSPAGPHRPRSGFHLMSTPGPKREVVLHRFDGTVWAEISPRVIEGEVQTWLTEGARAEELKHGTRHVPFEPSASKVRDVVRAIENAVLVMCDEDRFWVKPAFDDRGEALWWDAAWGKHDKVHAGKPKPEQILTFLNVQLARSDLERGIWNPMRCSPLLYNRTCFPYELPMEQFKYCLEGGSFDEMIEQYAPVWKNIYLKELGWDDAEIGFLQLLGGYWQCFDLSHKECNLTVFTGDGDTGKSTAEDAVTLMVGEQNIVKTSIEDVAGDQFHLSSYRHKLLAVVSEQEWTDRASRNKFKRVIKTLTGGGTLNTRGMYEKARENDRLWTRILYIANELPEMEDNSGALLNRVRVLDFRRVVDKDKLDPTVRQRVKQEGLGLVIWALEGLIKGYNVTRFEQPSGSSNPMRIFADFSSGMENFVRDWLTITQGPGAAYEDDQAFLSSRRLHEAFCKWKGWDPAKSEAAVTNRKIFAMLRKCGWRSEYSQPLRRDPKNSNDQTVPRDSGYKGLRLSAHAEKMMSYTEGAAAGSSSGGGSGQPDLAY